MDNRDRRLVTVWCLVLLTVLVLMACSPQEGCPCITIEGPDYVEVCGTAQFAAPLCPNSPACGERSWEVISGN
jgi:hypothetical protein